MITCDKCGTRNDIDAKFCKGCGNAVTRTGTPMTQPQKSKVFRFLKFLPLTIAIWAAGFYFFMGKGCSSVSGNLVSAGNPLGAFIFTPDKCKSGHRMQFFGAVILGKGQTDGAVIPFFDPVKGKAVKIEIPGSCKAPDYEECTEVIIDPKHCSTHKISLVRTGTEVNDVRLIDGSLEVDCKFPEGGTLKGKMKFDSCD